MLNELTCLSTIGKSRYVWKKFLPYLILLFLFINSCKDAEPTAPRDTPQDQPLAEKNIGPEGGILETEDFKLEISAGTLTEEAKLKLYPDKDENPYPDNSLTKRYLIEGFPSDYKNPIRIKIKYSGSLGKSNYITFGEKVFIPSMAKEDFADKFIPATDSAGFLKATIPYPDKEAQFLKIYNAEQNKGWTIKFGGIFSNTEVTTPQEHFKMIWLASGPANIEGMRSVGEYLEKSYSKFLEPDLGFSYENRTNWPVDVSIKKLETTVNAFYTPSLRGRNYGNISINSDYFLNPSVKYTCIHEYFHLVQDLYDPRPAPLHASIFNFQHYWVMEAASSWSELLFSDDPNYLPSGLPANNIAPFNGFQRGAEGSFEKARDHGYGMSCAIIYLAGRYGKGVVKKIFDNIKAGKHPIDAIRISAESPQLWLEDFFKDYLTNSRWNNSQLLSVPYGTIKTITPLTTDVSFNEDYPDLSARYYRFSLSGSFNETSELVFTLKNGTAIDNDLTILKKRPNENALILDYSLDPKISVSKIADLAKDGYDIICIVTNSKSNSPYTSVTPMTLEVKLESIANIVKKYKKGYIDLHIKGYYIWNGVEDSHTLHYYNTYTGDQSGSFINDSTFSSSWYYKRIDDYPVAGTEVTQSGTIEVIFSQKFDKIILYTETNFVNWPGWYTTHEGVIVKNIPFYETNYYNSDTYLLKSGAETCGYLVSRNHQHVWYDGSSVTFSRNECDEDSYIKITLYED